MNVGAPRKLEHREEQLQQQGGPGKTHVDVGRGHSFQLLQYRRDISLGWALWPLKVVVVVAFPTLSVHFNDTHTCCIFAV